MDVAVVGGGAVGVTLAYDLADRGADVTLYEAEEIAAGASGRAAGLCYDAFADSRDADLAARSLERFRDLAGGGSFDFTDRPYVWLARESRSAGAGGSSGSEDGDGDGDGGGGSGNEDGDEPSRDPAATIREQVERMRDRGLDVSLSTGRELEARFPGVVGRDVAVAAVAENAGHVDPGEYTRTLALMARMAGADVREGTPASVTAEGAVETPDGRVDPDAVVVAAGAHTRSVVADVAPLPVKPYRVQALVTEAADVSPPMLYDATSGFYLRPFDGGLLVGNGTEPIERDPDDWDRSADDSFVADCAMYQERALGWSWPTARSWAGLCTATPDGDPLVGELAEGVHVATGWQGHGLMRAPGVSERLAEQVLGDGAPISGFEPTRFDGDASFEIVEGMALARR